MVSIQQMLLVLYMVTGEAYYAIERYPARGRQSIR